MSKKTEILRYTRFYPDDPGICKSKRKIYVGDALSDLFFGTYLAGSI